MKTTGWKTDQTVTYQSVIKMFALLGNFSCFFLLSAVFFSKFKFSKKSLEKIIMQLEWIHIAGGPDLGPNCLQRLSSAWEGLN